MKKFITLLFTISLLSYNVSFSQEEIVDDLTEDSEMQDDTSSAVVDSVVEETTIQVVEEEEIQEVVEESQSFHYAIKEQFIQGGWQFMGIVLLCLILGLAVAIETIITLNLATNNTKKTHEQRRQHQQGSTNVNGDQ